MVACGLNTHQVARRRACLLSCLLSAGRVGGLHTPHLNRRRLLAAAATASVAVQPAVLQAASAAEGPQNHLTEYDPRHKVIYDTLSHSFLPASPEAHLGSALRRRDGPRVILAADTYTQLKHPVHHAAQFEMVKAVHQLGDAPTVIGLECFNRRHQPALDEFVFGDGSFDVLRNVAGRGRSWGYDLGQYAKVLAYAKAHGIRVVGLNVPREAVELVATHGVGALSATPFASQIPEMDMGNRDHLKRFVDDLAAGGAAKRGMSAERLRSNYEAVTLMDEYIAESIAMHQRGDVPLPDALKTAVASTSDAGAGGSARLVALVGAARVRGRVGVPNRVSRRTAQPTFSMLPQSVPWAANGLPDIERPLDRSESDWVLYTQGEIVPEVRMTAFGPPVRLEPPRVSDAALGTSNVIQI